MGPFGSKAIEVKGQIYFFLFVPLFLPGPSRRVKFTSIRNEFNFSDVHGAMNGSGSLAKLT